MEKTLTGVKGNLSGLSAIIQDMKDAEAGDLLENARIRIITENDEFLMEWYDSPMQVIDAHEFFNLA